MICEIKEVRFGIRGLNRSGDVAQFQRVALQIKQHRRIRPRSDEIELAMAYRDPRRNGSAIDVFDKYRCDAGFSIGDYLQ